MEVIINQLGNIEIIPSSQSTIDINLNPVPINGVNGKSAYEIAVDNGFVGTEQEWLDGLKTDALQWNSTNW